jgi:hypothetical protein
MNLQTCVREARRATLSIQGFVGLIRQSANTNNLQVQNGRSVVSAASTGSGRFWADLSSALLPERSLNYNSAGKESIVANTAIDDQVMTVNLVRSMNVRWQLHVVS